MVRQQLDGGLTEAFCWNDLHLRLGSALFALSPLASYRFPLEHIANIICTWVTTGDRRA
jgi:hypothetical protein